MSERPPGGRLAYTIRNAFTGEFWDFAGLCWTPRPARAKGRGPGPLAWREAPDLFQSGGPPPFRGTYIVEITREFEGAEIREAWAFWPFPSAAAFVFANQQEETEAEERPRPAPRPDAPRPASPPPHRGERPKPAPAERAATSKPGPKPKGMTNAKPGPTRVR